MTMLNDETCNNVQRFGATQGLSELLASYHSEEKLKGFKIMVYMLHQSEHDLLLELLEEGLEFEDYRVRESTLVLIGDLLNGLAGH